MKREVSELAWRTRLLFGLAVLGAWAGAWGWAWWLAEESGGSRGWGLGEWFAWAKVLFEKGFGNELAVAAAVGAGVLALPVLFLMVRGGSASRPHVY